MNAENFVLVAATISAHRDNKLTGRMRLQKTINLLQRLGLPSDYQFSVYFYGPYSDALASDVKLLEDMKFIREDSNYSRLKNCTYFNYEAQPTFNDKFPDGLRSALTKIESTNPDILELAATFLAYKDIWQDQEKALKALKMKKKNKVNDENLSSMEQFLDELNLDSSTQS